MKYRIGRKKVEVPVGYGMYSTGYEVFVDGMPYRFYVYYYGGVWRFCEWLSAGVVHESKNKKEAIEVGIDKFRSNTRKMNEIIDSAPANPANMPYVEVYRRCAFQIPSWQEIQFLKKHYMITKLNNVAGA